MTLTSPHRPPPAPLEPTRPSVPRSGDATSRFAARDARVRTRTDAEVAARFAAFGLHGALAVALTETIDGIVREAVDRDAEDAALRKVADAARLLREADAEMDAAVARLDANTDDAARAAGEGA